jgi:hypothetical protein
MDAFARIWPLTFANGTNDVKVIKEKSPWRGWRLFGWTTILSRGIYRDPPVVLQLAGDSSRQDYVLRFPIQSLSFAETYVIVSVNVRSEPKLCVEKVSKIH